MPSLKLSCFPCSGQWKLLAPCFTSKRRLWWSWWEQLLEELVWGDSTNVTYFSVLELGFLMGMGGLGLLSYPQGLMVLPSLTKLCSQWIKAISVLLPAGSRVLVRELYSTSFRLVPASRFLYSSNLSVCFSLSFFGSLSTQKFSGNNTCFSSQPFCCILLLSVWKFSKSLSREFLISEHLQWIRLAWAIYSLQRSFQFSQ